MDLSTVLWAILIVLLTTLFCYLYRFRSYVYSLGLPVDTSSLWKIHKTDFRIRDEIGIKKFGRLWVDYTGTVPEIIVAEPDLIKEIMVKHFDSFVNRVYYGVEEQHTSLIDARYLTRNLFL